MAASWYKIFNLAEFNASGLVSQTLLLNLPDRGQQTFEIFKGNEVNLVYADAFLPVDFLGMNPYVQGDYAVYRDDADDVWLGIQEDE
jgi:hypothetical protein